jgi:hypothetical protein
MKLNFVGAAAIAAAACFTDVLPQANTEELSYAGTAKPYTDAIYYHDDPTQKAERNEYHYYGEPRSDD